MSTEKVDCVLVNKEIDYSLDMKQRIKQNQAKLSLGFFLQFSELVRDLTCMEQIKALNNSERTILMQAKRLLSDEFASIKKISNQEAGDVIEGFLKA